MSRSGDWFTTFSGWKYFLVDPHPDDVCITDIAHALSLVCRFGGHCTQHYSVGQHSTLCREIARDQFHANILLQLHLLLHDASEAYIGDIVRPLKMTLPEYRALEKHTMDVIYQALELPKPTAVEHEIIKRIDNELLMAERRDLLNHGGHTWNIKEEPWEGQINPLPPFTVKLRFLTYYKNLMRAYNGDTWMIEQIAAGRV